MSKLSEEEIIEILEDIIKNLNGIMEIKHTNYNKAKAIQGLLDLYQKEKEKNKFIINKNLDDKYEEVLEKTFQKYIDKDFVSKDKIREKIDKLIEIHKERDFTRKESYYLDCYTELLEEE